MALAQYAECGLFAPRKIADVLHTSSDDVARTLGLGRDALQRKDRVKSDKTQRPRDIVAAGSQHIRNLARSEQATFGVLCESHGSILFCHEFGHYIASNLAAIKPGSQSPVKIRSTSCFTVGV